MKALAIVTVIRILGLALANLSGIVYIVIKLYQEKGLLYAWFGCFFGSIYPFIWGWLNVDRFKMYDVIIFWTAISIFWLISRVITSLLGRSNEALFQR